MIDLIVEPFQYSFMVRALFVSSMIGIICPVLGSYVVIRGMGFMGDAMAHSVLPGIVIALIVGVSPFLGSVPMAILVAVTVGYLIRSKAVTEDTAFGVLFAGLFSIGLVIISVAGGLAVSVEDILLGQILGVSNSDILISFILTMVVMISLIAFHRQLIFSGFDPVGSVVAGLNVGALNYMFLILLGIAIVVTLHVVGVVLVVGLLVTPSAAAQLVIRRFTKAMMLAISFGLISAVTGL
ncbi:MAG TPA: manganese ABC transporter permease, partial [Dehalococcoidia bacterium]|nr:manganese ABC transporter permease [Dehalococcoidia bacterium]